MLRGIDKRNIFLDNEDRRKFIEKLKIARETAGFRLHGYCLMDNHVHLLIEENEEIGTSIKRITVGYVQWHNNKHERTGHLFQNRYLSEPVETDAYLLTVLRYIHQNPVKAKITSIPLDYYWSSYNHYISAYQNKISYVDTDMIKAYFKDQETYERFMNTQNIDECLEYNHNLKITDSQLKALLEKEINSNEINEKSRAESNKIIKDVYKQTGASIRQLERVTGISKAVIEKALQ